MTSSPDPWLHRPVSDTPWSADFVMQSLEILPVFFHEGRIRWLKPEHAPSLQVGWPTGAAPNDLVRRALAPYGLEPIVIHSTSWRQDGSEVVLTYVATVDPGQVEHQRGIPLRALDAQHTALARGAADAPPERIDVEQVLEHALRHLAWLAKDDPVVREELAAWADALDGYEPEPFRAL